jgi:hypothetical protein
MYLGMVLFLNSKNTVNNMSPKYRGSVGTNNPSPFVNSSMLTDKGVKKARLKKTIFVWYIAA